MGLDLRNVINKNKSLEKQIIASNYHTVKGIKIPYSQSEMKKRLRKAETNMYNAIGTVNKTKTVQAGILPNSVLNNHSLPFYAKEDILKNSPTNNQLNLKSEINKSATQKMVDNIKNQQKEKEYVKTDEYKKISQEYRDKLNIAKKNYEDKYQKAAMANEQYKYTKLANDDIGIFDKVLGPAISGAASLVPSKYKLKNENGDSYRPKNYYELKQEKILNSYDNWAGRLYGTATYELGKIGATTVVNAVSSLATGGTISNLGTATYFSDIFSDSYNRTVENGYSDNQALIYATITTAAEFAFGKLIGGTAKALGMGSSELSKGISNKLTQSLLKEHPRLANAIASAISEGNEEFIQEYIDKFTQNIVLDKNTVGKTLSDTLSLETLTDASYSALVGAITGTMTGATNKNYYNKENFVDKKGNVKTKLVESNINNITHNQIINNSLANNNDALNIKYSQDNSNNVFQYEQSDNNKINNYRKSASRYFNNSQEAHNYLSSIEKIIVDKGYNVIFDNTITNSEGISVNGQIRTLNNGEIEIRLNPNSPKSGEFLIMHEVTHAIETQEMKDLVLDFASKHKDFSQALEDLKRAYKTNDVSSEVLSDISGQLFGNQEFINNLSMEKPTVFKRIYNAIVSLANKITGNNNMSLFVKDLKIKWENAYRTQSNNLNGQEYSISSLKGLNNLEDSNFKKSGLSNYQKALDMKSKGIDNETIRQNTKWFQDRNGDWKFEIDDSSLTLNNNIIQKNGTYKLDEIISHNMLFKLYPELKNYEVKFTNKKGLGSFYFKDNIIEINNNFINSSNYKELKGTLLHEIQHAIQHIEGFETGRSSKLSKKAYYNSLGEIEANDTKSRYMNDLTKDDRQTIAPESSKLNPKHPQLDNYMNNRKNIDKVKDIVYPYIERRIQNDKKNQEIISQNSPKNNALVDGRGLLDNSSFSLDKYAKIDTKYSQDSNTWQEYLDRHYKPTGTRTNMQDIKIPTKKDINKVNLPLVDKDVKFSEESIEEPKVAHLLDRRPLKYQKGLKEEANKIYQKIVDKGKYVADLAKKTNNKELYSKYDQMGTARGTAEYSIGVEQVNNKGEKIGKSLVDIWEPITESGKEFDFSMYLLHKHNIDRFNQGKPIFGEDITSDMSKEEVVKYEKQNPEFIEWSKDINVYNKNLLQNMVDAGLTSEESQQYYNDTYNNYIRIYRDMTGNSPITMQNGKLKVNNPIKKAKGGTQDILPLKDSMAQQTLEVTNAIRRNEFGLELLKTLGSGENVTEYGNEIISKNEDGTYSFVVFDNGKPIRMEIDEGLYESIKPTKKSDVENILPLKVSRKLLQFQRGLITDKNPFFLVRNFFKDLGDAPLNSKYTSKFLPNFARAYNEIINNGEYARLYKAMGGYQQSYFDNDSGLKLPSKNLSSKFVQAIQNVNRAVEMAPRLAEFISTIESGESIQTAMYNAAEITTNFKRGGEVTKALNRNFSNFLNASIQGFDKQFRNFTGQNGAKGYINLLSKAVVFGVIPSLLNHLLLQDDEDYEELPNYIKDNYYLFKTSNNNFIRIPKGRVVSIFGNAAYRTIEFIKGDKDAYKEFLSNAATNVAPNNPIGSNVLSPFIQVATNKSWNGSDIVPQRLQNLPNKEQFDEKTDEISKIVGKIFNISPKKVNYLLDQYSGVFGDTLLPIFTPQAENNPLTSSFSVNSEITNKYSSNFYDLKDEVLKKANSVNATDEDILKNKYLNSIQSEISDLYKEKREIQMSSMKDSAKRKEVEKIQTQINDIAKNSIKNYKKINNTGNFAVVDDMYFYKNKDNEWEKVKPTDKGLNLAIDLQINMEEYIKYKNTEFKSDKDSNGKTITNSRKNKIIKYVNDLKLSLAQKAIIIKMEYSNFDNYNNQIIKYINSQKLTIDEKEEILTSLGFTIRNGRVYW